MATKIIKEGQKKFTTTCPICGCEFEYELEDLRVGDRDVRCPCCGHFCIHKNFESPNNNGNIIYPYGPNEIPCDKDSNPDSWLKKPRIVYTNQQSVKRCEDCHIYQKMMKGEYTVDDSCFWCPNNPYKVTCNVMNNKGEQ